MKTEEADRAGEVVSAAAVAVTPWVAHGAKLGLYRARGPQQGACDIREHMGRAAASPSVPMGLATMGVPVSVCHQLSTTFTPGSIWDDLGRQTDTHAQDQCARWWETEVFLHVTLQEARDFVVVRSAACLPDGACCPYLLHPLEGVGVEPLPGQEEGVQAADVVPAAQPHGFSATGHGEQAPGSHGMSGGLLLRLHARNLAGKQLGQGHSM